MTVSTVHQHLLETEIQFPATLRTLTHTPNLPIIELGGLSLLYAIQFIGAVKI